MMTLLDFDIAQEAYKERLHQAEQNIRLLVLENSQTEDAPAAESNGLVDQVKRWLGAQPRREGDGVRHPRTA